jgi:16S rRNA (guanine966-N2)-methyltransferase
MRIIGGTAKGRRVVVPKGSAVRPTAAKVKQSLFDILPRDFSGMTVLDLFAGTGNVSMEALSRGAERAVLVEVSERTAAVVRKNLDRLGFSARSQVWTLPVARALRSLAKRGETFDLIFLDPPYDQRLIGVTLKLIAQSNLLIPAGVVVAEHSAREEIKSNYGGLNLHDQRRYGDTLLSFFKSEAGPHPAA